MPARSAAWLFVIAGVVTLVDSWVPGSGPVRPDVMDVVGLVAVVIGTATWLAPWERWPPRVSLVLGAAAFGLIAAGDGLGVESPFTYAVYFVVVFTWVGVCHPRGTGLRLAPVAAAVYVLPLLVTAHRGQPGGVASVAVAVPVCVLVGETVSWAMEQLEDARRQAEHRARLLRAVVAGTTTITGLDVDRILDAVADAVSGLGLDMVGLAVFGGDGDRYRFRFARGLPPGHAAAVHPAAAGLPGLVRLRRATVVANDYPHHPAAVPELAVTGLRAAIGCPVWVHGELAAVLFAGSRGTRPLATDDAEALTLLAGHAGRALENARRFGRERRARRLLAEVSRRDELTGIGNRRHAMALLAALQPGDAVVMIDLDHFKRINDARGHEAGDRVLQALAGYLRASVRDADLVARYGGEEFLVVLREASGTGLEAAQRLVDGWRRLSPGTTFSAGVAVHAPGAPAETTVARADAALYEAKRAGRDRVRADLLDVSAG